MADEKAERTGDGGELTRKLAAAVLGSAGALLSIAFSLGQWKSAVEWQIDANTSGRIELERRIERLELLLLGGSAHPDTTEAP